MTKRNDGKSVKKWVAIALFVVAAALSVVTMGKVAINYNLSDYLGKDTQTKIALDVIEREFGTTGDMQVMAKNVSADTADEILGKIEGVEHVLNVNFDKYDEKYFKNGNALYIIVIDGDDYSENAKQVAADVKSALSSYDGIEYGGTTIEKQALQDSITSEMTYILAFSLCLVAAILLITSESWAEPIILLVSSGAAVLINRGTNVFFGEISYITNSISAILQLALSIDYSIVLLHAYRREKETAGSNDEAMSRAVKSVLKPVSASALTTIAGLLALLFMSFRIGFDIGVVLMKGIVISAVTSVTLLPSLALLFDKLMKKTHKKAFAPKGKAFCKTAYKACGVIVPVALVIIIVCGVLQTGNTFVFTDTKAGNKAISDVFGNNNTVVAVYKNSGDVSEKEKKFIEAISDYKTKDGKTALTDYTAYANTVREVYDVEKASQKLELDAHDAKLLFAMYNLYLEPTKTTMTFSDFVDFANELIGTDEDVKDFVDEETTETIKTLKTISEVTTSEQTADELYEKLSDAIDGADISLFSVKQLYGMYFYDEVAEKNVDFKTALDFTISASVNENVKDYFDEETVTQLRTLSAGIDAFETQMEMPTDKTTFKMYYYQNCGVLLSDEQVERIYGGYFASTGEEASETIEFLPLMKFLAASGTITDESAAKTIAGYDELYTVINSAYGFENFLPVLSRVATALSGETPQIAVTNETVRQIYIMYFYAAGAMPNGKMSGKTFADYALSSDKTNVVVHGLLTDETRDKLRDMLTVYGYAADKSGLNYEEIYEKLDRLRGELKSEVSAVGLDKDKISGVYIKYALKNDEFILNPIVACDLLDFVSENMDKNSLLKEKMNEENRGKVSDAQSDIEKAEDLFFGENYSRMLLSVDLPNGGADTNEFIDYASEKVKEIFGEDAYVAGEIASTYDLEKSFSHDNLFITIFTLVSIFIIVTIIFRSLSLPVILVAVIQGAIFIAMSTQLLSSGIFFMSYIVTTCILMGATIDYGILMSSNYIADRAYFDKKKSLEMSVEAAMPTVFTSGLILTVCGFVIHFVSSQNSISTVGLLLGIGTICSVVMITVVLPSVLYLLDGFILKLSIKKKNKQN